MSMNGAVPSKGFALDRTPEGYIKINPVSVGNLVALITLVSVAVGTYTSMVNSIALLNERITTAQAERARVEQAIKANQDKTDTLNEKFSLIQQRLGIIETITQRLDRKIDTLVK